MYFSEKEGDPVEDGDRKSSKCVKEELALFSLQIEQSEPGFVERANCTDFLEVDLPVLMLLRRFLSPLGVCDSSVAKELPFLLPCRMESGYSLEELEELALEPLVLMLPMLGDSGKFRRGLNGT